MQNQSKSEVTFYFFFIRRAQLKNVDMIYSIYSCMALTEAQM